MAKKKAVSSKIVTEVVSLLAELGEVRAKAMFGGYGIYCGPTFFGLIARDRLYFKVDDDSRGEYASRGTGPFSPAPGKVMKSYYEVPRDVFENDEELVRWARRAVAVAQVS
ncbi:MAG: TfoX/Sxy family protein [Candidatus Saccharimonas sp.]|nr:TfoX/Sxy family protein [Planctomycetaceae bacterium]